MWVRRWRSISILIGIGWYIGLSLILPTIGGRWLDNRLGTNIFFSFMGLMLGAIIAFWGTYYFLYPLAKRGDKGAKASH